MNYLKEKAMVEINTAEIGISLQKAICDKYGININQNAVNQFNANYNKLIAQEMLPIIDNIFSELKTKPIECLTYAPSPNAKEKYSPHNFILSNGKTLSVRTNKAGDKVAPRVVGQCGIERFNEHFESIAGYCIDNKEEIKKIIFDHIDEMLPIFIDYLFVSDYTVWIQYLDKKYSYVIFDSSKVADIDLQRSNFTFTKNLEEWNESTTLKYKNKSIAEIQIHKNRTFKFRFIMTSLSEFLVSERITTETLGISAEKAICDIFDLPVPESYKGRYSPNMVSDITPAIREAFTHLPKAIGSTGALTGIRGKNSKCSYDFVLEEDKKLSLKTNTGKMICPPEVGQPGAETCYLYFKEYIDGDTVTSDSFKNMVYNHIEKIMPIYVSHLFDSDYLLWVYKRKEHFEFKIYNSDFARNAIWKKEHFSFSKPNIEEWNESNTIKYFGFSIGEFQVHKNRNCFKFRFNIENFEYLINTYAFD